MIDVYSIERRQRRGRAAFWPDRDADSTLAEQVDLSQFPGDSEAQQVEILRIADRDAFNWGCAVLSGLSEASCPLVIHKSCTQHERRTCCALPSVCQMVVRPTCSVSDYNMKLVKK